MTVVPVVPPRTCSSCGCTDDDCSQCIERIGEPCSWLTADLCSACLQVLPMPGEGEVLFVLSISDEALLFDAAESVTAHAYEVVSEVAPGRAHLAVLTSGLTLDVLTDEQLAPLGLQRIPS